MKSHVHKYSVGFSCSKVKLVFHISAKTNYVGDKNDEIEMEIERVMKKVET